MWKAITDDSIPFKRECCESSCGIWRAGTSSAVNVRGVYNELLAAAEESLVVLLSVHRSKSVYHLYVVRTSIPRRTAEASE